MKGKVLNIIFVITLFSFTIYIILNTFILTKVYVKVENNSDKVIEKQEEKDSEEEKIDITNTSYKDSNIKIEINELRKENTTVYVADIKLSDSSYLKTAFAKSSYGKNITEKTSEISSSVNAILSINGDYYGVQESGYVLKNGVIYRNNSSNNQEDLVIYKDGSFKIINENDISAEELLDEGAYNILSFGPALVQNSIVTVEENEKVGKAMGSNPRTAIGIIEKNHYVFVVSDGRTSESTGLSLYELANVLKELGCQTAYNLDGGGSSTMVFNKEVINNPTTMGRTISERSVSDIVYIGY